MWKWIKKSSKSVGKFASRQWKRWIWPRIKEAGKELGEDIVEDAKEGNLNLK